PCIRRGRTRSDGSMASWPERRGLDSDGSTPTRDESSVSNIDRLSPMAKLKSWFHVVTPREDLREGKPLDASEFAVNLEDILEGRARKDYQEPQRFFERTYLTRNLKDQAAQAV